MITEDFSCRKFIIDLINNKRILWIFRKCVANFELKTGKQSKGCLTL